MLFVSYKKGGGRDKLQGCPKVMGCKQQKITKMADKPKNKDCFLKCCNSRLDLDFN